ncbi:MULTISPECIES: hypothetical protein [Acinetobacter]|jgi:hypothetical protein|uniref:Uncharacterized protein n=2 Tax=Acinetobacter TaxID=469 RepID=A0A833U088_ACIBZ|nr:MULTISPECIES: hypothetical protein [Acinetobacter]KAF1026911.1 MAG: hypothetical protein GAK29_00995 [Acinetobacter bereziniae]MBP2545507.1 hypothetical protein [Acinetobacter guillouiae]MCX5469559.1 hypothetical protein [Acinetobacter nematophilus]MDG3556297.1 hypothetical protein [Acinetobacter bereziniae]MDP6002962.1 hypothetical protein [Acinetobacter bereziniae]
MRAIAGIICIVAVICFLGLPFIGMMIVFGLFYLLAQYAFGGNK